MAGKKLSSVVGKLEPIIIQENKPKKDWLTIVLIVLTIASLFLLSFFVWQYYQTEQSQNEKTLIIKQD